MSKKAYKIILILCALTILAFLIFFGLTIADDMQTETPLPVVYSSIMQTSDAGESQGIDTDV